jgi:uncharacterized protein YjiS (DUF1127 family)
MPPQQTNITIESGLDTAGPGLVVALVEGAARGAMARGSPDVPIATPQETCSEKEAAGPPVAPTRSALSLVVHYCRRFREWRQRERLRTSLHALSERELMDIGLSSGEIDHIVASRAIGRLRDHMTYR